MTINEAAERYGDLPLSDALHSRMAFGKYAGKELATVPYSYIQWITYNVPPHESGAEKVYRMIFAARKICNEMQMPDAMPFTQKYQASPADIIGWSEQKNIVASRPRRTEGRWVIKDAKNSQA